MAANSEDLNAQAAHANGTMPPPTTNGSATDGTTTTAPGLSADEIALYDRQIRLWGAQAQERIRSANILLVSLRALGTEIAKNLVLAGISSLTIVDDDPVTEEDLGAQFFLREEEVGMPVSVTFIACHPSRTDTSPRKHKQRSRAFKSLILALLSSQMVAWPISSPKTKLTMLRSPAS